MIGSSVERVTGLWVWIGGATIAAFVMVGCDVGGLPSTSTSSSTSSSSSSTSAGEGVQKWVLLNQMGDQAYVTIKPFTYSGAFSESSDSPHWWLYDGAGKRVAKFNIGGNIFHAGQYDTWDFVTFSASGGGMNVHATVTGRTTDGVYPNAHNVKGTIQGTAASPMDTHSTADTWTGHRIN